MKAKMEKTINKDLRDRVERQLEWQPDVTSTDIGVSAEDGVITLTGTVRSYTEKMAAEKAAHKTYGVKAVANDIIVHPFMQVTDADIAATARKTLELQSNIPDERIKLTVKGGYIYLSGSVDWMYQKEAAEKAVSHLYGAKGVVNNLEIKTCVSGTDVQERIEAAFKRSAEVDARRITITANGSTVSLWGNVRTWTGNVGMEEQRRPRLRGDRLTKSHSYHSVILSWGAIGIGQMFIGLLPATRRIRGSMRKRIQDVIAAERETELDLLLICGAVAAMLYVVGDILSAIRYTGYSYSDQTVNGCCDRTIWFGAGMFGKAWRLYSIATMVVLILFGAIAGSAGPRISAGLATPWVGLMERVNIYGYMLWLANLSALVLYERVCARSATAAKRLIMKRTAAA